jgi:putative endonuclease
VSAGAYSLYIVRCADGSLYTGIATDVERRLREHEDGVRGAKYLRGRGPLVLEFVEHLGSRSAASRAEHRIKKLERHRKEALIAGSVSISDLLVD